MLTRMSISLLAGVMLLALTLSTTASAKGPEVRVPGVCSKASTAKLKLKLEDGGRIEVEFEVDQNVNGVKWNVTLTRAGKVLFSAKRMTRAPSGSFELNRLVSDAVGSDRIIAKASRTGEICRAAATI